MDNCPHRGECQGTTVLSDPWGDRIVPVYGCNLHTQCTVDLRVAGIRFCSDCPDKPKEAADGRQEEAR